MNIISSPMNTSTRRDFLRTTGAAASALALAQPFLGLAQDAGKPVVVAFVGCAHIHTPSFVNLLKGRPDVKVKYVWDPDIRRSEVRSKQLPGSKVVTDVNAVWSDPEVQAVVICSETGRHKELIAAAAKAKKHVFAEKPLGITAAESKEMADAIEQAGLLFTTGYFMRTDPKHLFLKDQIAQGNLGKITRVRASNCHTGSLGGWFDEKPNQPAESWRWMADPKQAGVGAFGDLGTHMLDIMMWLLGDVESITAQVNVVTGRYGDCDESGEALMKFKNGALGTLAAGWVDVMDPVTLQISGTEGHAVIVNGQLYFKSSKVDGTDGKKPWTTLPSAPQLPLHQFINAVSGKTGQPLVTPREAAARVSVMEAAYQGAKSNTWVKPQ